MCAWDELKIEIAKRMRIRKIERGEETEWSREAGEIQKVILNEIKWPNGIYNRIKWNEA